ncbi:hypothetical protein FOA52_015904 [Chlamydomonas sp. UWO 241]|nr:hypothetical protein FOA52_015904 [Chlamydomonas sp. UWO 241]
MASEARRKYGAGVVGGDDSDTGTGTAGEDVLLILQHAPVYTLGSGSTTDHVLFDALSSPIPLVRTERGGEVTYHGPGQLVMYPILDLQSAPHSPDLHWYMRSLEQVIIDALAEVSGIEATRVPGMTGVWVGDAKLAALGVRARKWVTYHGVALNVVPDLVPFGAIVPCGIKGRRVGSVRSTLEEAEMTGDPLLTDGGVLGVQTGEQLLTEYRYGLLDAFEATFGVELVAGDVGADLPGARELLLSTRAAVEQVAP